MKRLFGRTLLCLASLAIGCKRPADGKRIDGAAAEASREANANTDDAQAAKMLAEKDSTAEAKAWLAAPKHTLWKGDRKAITALVDDLYKAGAKEVLAVGITKEPKFEMAAMFAVVMPTDPAARKKVLEVHNAFWKKYLDEDQDELKEFLLDDSGRKYILLNFDL